MQIRKRLNSKSPHRSNEHAHSVFNLPISILTWERCIRTKRCLKSSYAWRAITSCPLESRRHGSLELTFSLPQLILTTFTLIESSISIRVSHQQIGRSFTATL